MQVVSGRKIRGKIWMNSEFTLREVGFGNILTYAVIGAGPGGGDAVSTAVFKTHFGAVRRLKFVIGDVKRVIDVVR